MTCVTSTHAPSSTLCSRAREGHLRPGMSDLGPKWDRLAPNGTNSGLFRSDFCTNVVKWDEKKSEICPIWWQSGPIRGPICHHCQTPRRVEEIPIAQILSFFLSTFSMLFFFSDSHYLFWTQISQLDVIGSFMAIVFIVKLAYLIYYYLFFLLHIYMPNICLNNWENRRRYQNTKKTRNWFILKMVHTESSKLKSRKWSWCFVNIVNLRHSVKIMFYFLVVVFFCLFTFFLIVTDVHA